MLLTKVSTNLKVNFFLIRYVLYHSEKIELKGKSLSDQAEGLPGEGRPHSNRPTGSFHEDTPPQVQSTKEKLIN